MGGSDQTKGLFALISVNRLGPFQTGIKSIQPRLLALRDITAYPAKFLVENLIPVTGSMGFIYNHPVQFPAKSVVLFRSRGKSADIIVEII